MSSASLVLSLLLIGQAPYRQCQVAPRAATYQASYIAPTYAATNYASTYSTYQTTYTPVVKEVQFVAVEPYYATVIGQNLRVEKNAAEKATAEAKGNADLNARIDRLSRQLERLAAPTQVVPGPHEATPPPPRPSPPPIPPMPPLLSPNLADSLDQATNLPSPSKGPEATAILQAKCASCHTGGSAKGGQTLFNQDGSLRPMSVATKLLIDHVTYSGTMPPPPKKRIEDAEYTVLRAWISESSDEITTALRTPKKTTSNP